MVIYEGPSMLDGKPIVCIASAQSRNPKTSDMVQTWIMRADVPPMEAQRNGQDVSVCGTCPMKGDNGCYVLVFNAPRSTWSAWKRGTYARRGWKRRMAQALKRLPLRIGSYGDPAAVPIEVWRRLVADGCGEWTGYTHQWRNPRAALHRTLVMASCDSAEDAREAQGKGWRTFRVTLPGEAILPREVQCLSTTRHELTCNECGICDGARPGRDLQPASVWIQVHGSRANRVLRRLPVVR